MRDLLLRLVRVFRPEPPRCAVCDRRKREVKFCEGCTGGWV
jgi:hypothetical protein